MLKLLHHHQLLFTENQFQLFRQKLKENLQTSTINFCFLLQNYAVDNGFMTADDLTETTVRIKKLSPRQIGVYTCRAQNKLGSAEREFLVNILLNISCAKPITIPYYKKLPNGCS